MNLILSDVLNCAFSNPPVKDKESILLDDHQFKMPVAMPPPSAVLVKKRKSTEDIKPELDKLRVNPLQSNANSAAKSPGECSPMVSVIIVTISIWRLVFIMCQLRFHAMLDVMTD